MAFASDYVDVAARIAEFRVQHPNGSLQQVSLEYREFGGKSWVIYTAAAYRTPDDLRPGIGTAWEQVPGLTAFTKDSELQNAETSAWGRAIVAVGAADTKKGIASAQEVRNRVGNGIDPTALCAFAQSLPSAEYIAQLWKSLAGFPQTLRDEIAQVGRTKKDAEATREHASSAKPRDNHIR